MTWIILILGNNYLLGKIGANLNQIAKRINETRSIYRADMNEVKGEMEKLWKVQKAMLKIHRNLQRKCRRERNYVEHKKNTYYDNLKDNTAFERCIDITTRLILKYGPDMLEKLDRDNI